MVVGIIDTTVKIFACNKSTTKKYSEIHDILYWLPRSNSSLTTFYHNNKTDTTRVFTPIVRCCYTAYCSSCSLPCLVFNSTSTGCCRAPLACNNFVCLTFHAWVLWGGLFYVPCSDPKCYASKGILQVSYFSQLIRYNA